MGPDRREARSFEPPPWEQDQFDRFRREEAERAAEADLAAALAAVQSRPVQAAAPVIEAEVVMEADAGAEEIAAAPLPEAQVETMLIGLRGEEPRVQAEFTVVTNVVVGLLAVGGLGFVIWAATLLARTGGQGGPLAAMASVLMMLWGLMMVGGAALLWRKYNLRS